MTVYLGHTATKDDADLEVLLAGMPPGLSSALPAKLQLYLKNRYVFSPLDYGATLNDGNTPAKALLQTMMADAITQAVAHGAVHIHFPAGDYNLGSLANAERVFAFVQHSGFVITGDKARFICSTSDNTQPQIFMFQDTSDVYVQGLKLRDDGTVLTVDWHGANFFYLYNQVQSAGYLQHYRFLDVETHSAVSLLTVAGSAGARIRDIVLDGYAEQTYYGANFQENGDDFRGVIRTLNCRRSYFPYGIRNHTVDVTVRKDGASVAGANSICLVKRYLNDTQHIKLRVFVSGDLSNMSHIVTLEHQDTGLTGTGMIEDVEADIHVDPASTNKGTCTAVGIRSLDSNGNLLSTTTKQFDRITLRGSFGGAGGTTPVLIESKPSVEGRITFDPNIGMMPSFQRPHFPGFALRLTHNRELRTATGNLTTQNIVIPLAGLDSETFALRVTTYLHDDYTALNAQNATVQEDLLFGYNANAGAVVIQHTTNLIAATGQGTLGSVTYTASGETILVNVAGAPYTNANAFQQTIVEYLGRGPWYIE